MKKKNKFKCGVVSIIGKTNSGKSTLLNNMIGYKISITSENPQTTRFNIKGIMNIKDVAQVIFIDTPGILKPHNELGKAMLNEVKNAAYNVDLILFIASADELLKEEEIRELSLIEGIGETPVFLVINKIDKITKEDLFGIIDKFKDNKLFKEIIPCCARKGFNLDELKKTIVQYLNEGEKIYEDDFIDDLTDDLFIAEIIREKAISLTYKEVPYSIAVQVLERFKNEKNVLMISALIYVEKESHKGILIGKKANLIKKIGTLARKELEDTLGEKIYLDLRVRLKDDWRKDISIVRSIYKDKWGDED